MAFFKGLFFFFLKPVEVHIFPMQKGVPKDCKDEGEMHAKREVNAGKGQRRRNGKVGGSHAFAF